MKLEKFRVTNFRSVKDSGWVSLGELTAFVGRNEAGKTNLLQALRMLDREWVVQPLALTRDFPADLASNDHGENDPVVRAVWALDDSERESLAAVYAPGKDLTHIEVSRGYAAGLQVALGEPGESAEAPVERAKQILEHVRTAQVAGADQQAYQTWQQSLHRLHHATARGNVPADDWGRGVLGALAAVQEPVVVGDVSVDDETRSALQELMDLASSVAMQEDDEALGAQWMREHMPRLLYLDTFPEIDGRQDLAQFVLKLRDNQLEAKEHYFRMLLSMAGITTEDLETLLNGEPDVRRQMVGRASAAMTRRLRELWTDRPLKVRFDLDGKHFNTIISDPTAFCDVEVNLDQRSRGFRWFFSFWVMFAAGAKEGSTKNALLLLDGPGTCLHENGQQDLLRHLAEDFENQIVLTTQSPFLIPDEEGGAVRVTEIDSELGTVVREGEPEGFEASAPLALTGSGGESEVAKALFGDAPRLVVETMSDYWYLQAVSDYLAEKGRPALPRDIVVTPAGGAFALPLWSAIVGDGLRRSIVLVSDLDDAWLDALSEAGLDSSANVVHVAHGFPENEQAASDIEDLFDVGVYDRFVRFAYQKELEGKELEPDTTEPRFVARYEAALNALDIRFQRTRPARLLLRVAGRNPQSIFSKDSRERFERLFHEIERKHKLLAGR
ncbi:MAG: AAA family ATPase [Myxococcales bacterium]|nr:AAA family ATPase [Myxococcales bacterium]